MTIKTECVCVVFLHHHQGLGRVTLKSPHKNPRGLLLCKFFYRLDAFLETNQSTEVTASIQLDKSLKHWVRLTTVEIG